MSKQKNSITLGEDGDIAEVFPRKSRLAKRIIIRISNRRGIELIVPTRVSLKKAMDFLYKKEEWVLQKSRELRAKNKIQFIEGSQISILGTSYTIRHSGKLRGVSKIQDGELILSGLEEHIPRKTKQFLTQLAKTEITNRAEVEAKKLKVSFKRITIRDTSSRWGSCSKSGTLSFSWRLVLAPRPVMEYVVAHEVAHIIEMNHSKKFWDVVASIFPHHQQARRWLRAHGELLHSYGD